MNLNNIGAKIIVVFDQTVSASVILAQAAKVLLKESGKEFELATANSFDSFGREAPYFVVGVGTECRRLNIRFDRAIDFSSLTQDPVMHGKLSELDAVIWGLSGTWTVEYDYAAAVAKMANLAIYYGEWDFPGLQGYTSPGHDAIVSRFHDVWKYVLSVPTIPVDGIDGARAIFAPIEQWSDYEYVAMPRGTPILMVDSQSEEPLIRGTGRHRMTLEEWGIKNIRGARRSNGL